MAALSVQSSSGASAAVRQGRPELGVRRHAADDRDPLAPEPAAASRVRSTSARTMARW